MLAVTRVYHPINISIHTVIEKQLLTVALVVYNDMTLASCAGDGWFSPHIASPGAIVFVDIAVFCEAS